MRKELAVRGGQNFKKIRKEEGRKSKRRRKAKCWNEKEAINKEKSKKNKERTDEAGAGYERKTKCKEDKKRRKEKIKEMEKGKMCG